jgi:hypothetical protein
VAEIPLFTSIPARVSRLNTSGDDIGTSHQRTCIASWKQTGFSPVSVNGPAEPTGYDIRQITLARDASEITGRPHIYLDDMVEAIASDTDGPFAIVNADISIPPAAGLAHRAAAVEPGTFLFARRLDTEDINSGQGVPYRDGFDFFAGHARDLRDFGKTRFVFGMPWWDHYLPLLTHMHGLAVTQLEPRVLHLKHDERWEQSTWETFGEIFIAAMKQVAHGSYRWRLRALLRGATGGKMETIKASMRPRELQRPPGEFDDMLYRISDLNLHFLNTNASMAST